MTEIPESLRVIAMEKIDTVDRLLRRMVLQPLYESGENELTCVFCEQTQSRDENEGYLHAASCDVVEAAQFVGMVTRREDIGNIRVI